MTAPSQPVGELASTSAALAHRCHPDAQRSAAEQPAPLGTAPSSPPARPHVGSAPRRPGTWKPPLHAAMSGWEARSSNPSRSPSAHPISSGGRVVVVVEEVVVVVEEVVVDVVVVDDVDVVEDVVVVDVVEDVVVVELVVDIVEPVVVELVGVVVEPDEVVPPEPPSPSCWLSSRVERAPHPPRRRVVRRSREGVFRSVITGNRRSGGRRGRSRRWRCRSAPRWCRSRRRPSSSCTSRRSIRSRSA